jgi:hypothetical protein
VNDLDLSARLHDLADDLGDPHDQVSPESAIALFRRRRRTRAGLIATVAAVVAIAVGVPATVTGLSSDGEVAVPAPSTRPADTSPDPAHVAELQDVAARLPAVSLTSPSSWDQWLPDGRPLAQASIAEDALTCPRLSARLAEVTGEEMSYWTGALPQGPPGCTWVEAPLLPANSTYDYVISVGFLADGTTVDQFLLQREGAGRGTHPCPAVDLPSVADGALLLRCWSPDVSTTTYQLVVPDARITGGLWVLGASVQDAAPVRPAAILPVLVDGVVAAFG